MSEILNQIDNMITQLEAIKQKLQSEATAEPKKAIDKDFDLDKSLRSLGFKPAPDLGDGDDHYQYFLGDTHYNFWFCFRDEYCWGVSCAYGIIHASDDFDDFFECMKDYLDNKDVFQIRTVRGVIEKTVLVNLDDPAVHEEELNKYLDLSSIKWRLSF
jgi:hypothetical protein